MNLLYYILGGVISYFILIILMAKFVGIDSQDADEFMPALLITGLLSTVWPITLPLCLSGFGAYAVIKRMDKTKRK